MRGACRPHRAERERESPPEQDEVGAERKITSDIEPVSRATVDQQWKLVTDRGPNRG